MTKRNLLIGILLTSLLCAYPVGHICAQNQQEQVVSIFPITIETDRSSETLENLSKVIQDSLSITLRFMSGYKVIKAEKSRTVSQESLAAYVDQHNADSVIFGSIRRAGEDIQLKLSVYDGYEDKIFPPKSASTTSLFETFDIADKLVVELIENFSGKRVAYGSLEFVPAPQNRAIDPETELYTVFIDGQEIGHNIRRIDKLLIGTHEIRVVQDRQTSNVELFQNDLTIEAGANYKREIALPYLTEQEIKDYQTYDRAIVNDWVVPGNEITMEDMSFQYRVNSLHTNQKTEITAYSILYDKYDTWYSAYQKYQNDSPELATVAAAGPTFAQHRLNSSLSSAPLRLKEDAFVRSFFSFASVYEARQHMPKKVPVKIDGNFRDWEGHSALTYDGEFKDVDIGAVFISRTDDRLIIGAEIRDPGEPLKNSTVHLRSKDTEVLIITPLSTPATLKETPLGEKFVTRVWQVEQNGGKTFIGKGENAISADGYEIAVPLTLISEYCLNKPLEMWVEMEGIESSDTTKIKQVLIPVSNSR